MASIASVSETFTSISRRVCTGESASCGSRSALKVSVRITSPFCSSDWRRRSTTLSSLSDQSRSSRRMLYSLTRPCEMAPIRINAERRAAGSRTGNLISVSSWSGIASPVGWWLVTQLRSYSFCMASLALTGKHAVEDRAGIAESRLACGGDIYRRLNAEGAQQPRHVAQRQAHHVGIAVLEVLNRVEVAVLNTVRARLVERVAAGNVGGDLRIGVAAHRHRADGKLRLPTPAHSVEQRHPRHDVVSPPTQAAQHGRRFSCIGGLAEHVIPIHYNRIGGKD